jgi:hypothetical protein
MKRGTRFRILFLSMAVCTLLSNAAGTTITPHNLPVTSIALEEPRAVTLTVKHFDMLIVPNMSHAWRGPSNYLTRLRWDYFVRHLHGQEPPGYRIGGGS